MKCVKCGGIIKNDCCINCGYMTNGNYINKNKETDKFKDIRIYNDSFDVMYRNEKSYIVFLLGPLYISYRNHLFFGCLISLIDLLITNFMLTKFSDICSFMNLASFLLSFTFIFIMRVLYVVFSNTICLKLDSIKIKRIKKKNKYYEEILKKHENISVFKLILNIMFYIILFLTALYMKTF